MPPRTYDGAFIKYMFVVVVHSSIIFNMKCNIHLNILNENIKKVEGNKTLRGQCVYIYQPNPHKLLNGFDAVESTISYQHGYQKAPDLHKHIFSLVTTPNLA